MDSNSETTNGIAITQSGNDTLDFSIAGTDYVNMSASKTMITNELEVNVPADTDAIMKLSENDVLKWSIKNDKDDDVLKILQSGSTEVFSVGTGYANVNNIMQVD